MLDKLTVMQDATDSGRSPQSYENNWGDNIRVEIPETGVSIGEFQRFLKKLAWTRHPHNRRSLAHLNRHRGERARGAAPGATFTGPESDLDRLLQKVPSMSTASPSPIVMPTFFITATLRAL